MKMKTQNIDLFGRKSFIFPAGINKSSNGCVGSDRINFKNGAHYPLHIDIGSYHLSVIVRFMLP